MIRFIKNRYAEILLILLMLFIAFMHIRYFLLYDRPVTDHEYYYSGHVAVDSYYRLKSGDFMTWFSSIFIHTTTVQPQFVGRFMGLASYAFGLDRFIMRQINLVFYLLLIIFSYLLGKSLMDKKHGLLCAFLIVFTPIVVSHSRKGEPYFFEAALFIIGLYYLVKSGNFHKLSASLLFAVSLGFGILTYEFALIYYVIFFGYLIFCVILELSRRRHHDSVLNLNNILYVFIVLIFFYHIFYGRGYFQSIGVGPVNRGCSLLEDAYSYILELKYGLGSMNFWLFIAAFLIYLIRFKFFSKSHNYYNFIVVLTFFPFLILLFGQQFFVKLNYPLRLIFPLFPLLIIFTIYTFYRVKHYLLCVFSFAGNAFLPVFMFLNVINPINNNYFYNLKAYPECSEVDEGNNIFLQPCQWNAKRLKGYFQKRLKNKTALIVNFLETGLSDIKNQDYFEDLLLNGICYKVDGYHGKIDKLILLFKYYKYDESGRSDYNFPAYEINLNGHKVMLNKQNYPVALELLKDGFRIVEIMKDKDRFGGLKRILYVVEVPVKDRGVIEYLVSQKQITSSGRYENLAGYKNGAE